ncbi:hypothetical protein [Pseudomonas japonica]|uniref:Uncharacterized protein n=1 Tax=Pseudomonas japonica TaxID=256466 RepID=A0A239KY27_9PSED|nr:hypothetical protein [Pseudomonas japonica]SNT22920.1 hypothetical protein SAMN05444352_13015 [Pseudomonas japonica]
MKLTRYIYNGPQSAACLRTGNELLDVQLWPGQAVDLPADHDYTKVLLELKHLTLPDTAKPAKPGAAAKSEGDQANGS